MEKIFLKIILICLLLLFCKSNSYAQECKVVLNEIHPNPTGIDEEHEWVELYNMCNSTIDLTAIALLDSGDNKQLLTGFIKPNEFVLINVSIGLTNTKDTLRLISNQDKIVDSLTYSNAKEGVSISRETDGIGEWVDNLPPTPGKSNIPLYSTSIQISEIFPAPDRDKEEVEWIELHNFSDKEINLTNWIVADLNDSFILKNITILPGQYLVIEDEELKISLNDKADTISLLNPAKKIVSTMSYQNAQKSISFINYNKQILASKKVTCGSENSYVSVDDCFYGLTSKNINDVKEVDTDTQLTLVKGITTLQQGASLYFQDGTGGMLINLPDKNITIPKGTLIKTVINTKFINDLASFVVPSISCLVVEKKNVSTNYKHLKKDSELDQHLYELVNLNGEIAKNLSSGFWLKFDNKEIKVLLNESLRKFSRFELDILSVTGVLTTSSSSSKSEPTYVLMPRTSEDLNKISVDRQPSSHPTSVATSSSSSQIFTLLNRPTVVEFESKFQELAIKAVKPDMDAALTSSIVSLAGNLYGLWFILRNFFWF